MFNSNISEAGPVTRVWSGLKPQRQLPLVLPFHLCTFSGDVHLLSDLKTARHKSDLSIMDSDVANTY